MNRGFGLLLALCALSLVLAAAPPARAAPGDIVILSTQKISTPTTREGRKPLLVVGPSKVTPEIRSTKQTIYLLLEGTDFHEKAGAVTIYLIDPTKKDGRKIRFDASNYVEGIGSMEGSTPGTFAILEINDFEVKEGKGGSYKARTHLQQMSEVAVALEIEGPMTFERAIITTHPPFP